MKQPFLKHKPKKPNPAGNSGSFGNGAAAFAKNLAALIAANAQLVKVDLSRCELHDEGFGLVCDAVEGNATLSVLRVDCNRLSADMQQRLERAMQRETKPGGHVLDGWSQEQAARRRRESEAEKKRSDRGDGDGDDEDDDEPAAGGAGGAGEGKKGVSSPKKAKSPKRPPPSAAAAAPGAGGGGPEEEEEPRIDPAISNLRPGQTLKAGVSLGRPDNHICDVTAGGDLTLEAARELIMAALTVRLNEDYDFINLDGKIIDVEEEDKRMLLWECGRNVLLRPKSWVVL